MNGFTGPYDGTAHSATGSCKGIGDVVLAGLDLGASFTNVPGGTASSISPMSRQLQQQEKTGGRHHDHHRVCFQRLLLADRWVSGELHWWQLCRPSSGPSNWAALSPVKFGATLAEQGGAALITGIHTLQAIKYSSATDSDPPIDATPTDAATTGNQFRLTTSDWRFNLSTKGGFSAGTSYSFLPLSRMAANIPSGLPIKK